MSPQCKGIKKDGGRCSENAKESGYCATHQDQADDDHEVHAMQHTSSHNSSSSSSSTNNNRGNSAARNSSSAAAAADDEDWCQGTCQSGKPCTKKRQQNGYCHLHQNQAASSSSSSSENHDKRNSTAENSGAAADDDEDWCQGTCQSGKQCIKKPQQNGYCHLHQDQAASSSRGSSKNNDKCNSAARNSSSAAAAADDEDWCQGTCQSGKQCTKKPQQNGYCHLHQDQAASSSRGSSKNNDKGNSAAKNSVTAAADDEDWCQGTCQSGKQCTKNPQQNGYCHLHQDQAASSSRGSSKNNDKCNSAARNSSSAAAAADDEDWCQGTCQSGKPCTKKRQQNGYCHLHQNQAASRSSSSSENHDKRNSTAENSGAAADDDEDWCQGTCQSGKQCIKKPQQNGYCHLHQDQAASSSRGSSKNNDKGNSAAKNSVTAATDDEDWCQGTCQSGKQCTKNPQQNGYCHLHQDQAASSSRGSSKNNDKGNSAAKNSVTAADDDEDWCQGTCQSGKQCTKKPQQNGYCHLHQDQAASSSRGSSKNNDKGNSAAKNSATAADDDEDWCQGTCQSGKQCTKNPQQNGYCHLHQDQAASSSRGSSKNNDKGNSAAKNSVTAAAADEDWCQGTCQSGKQCIKNPQQTGYCHLHQDQAASSSSSKNNNKGSSTSRNGGAAAAADDGDDEDWCQGTCQSGKQCTKKPQQNGYCHLHQNQAASSSSSSSTNNNRRAATGTSRGTVVVAVASVHELSARLRSDTKDDLEQEQYRPYRSVEVAGCNGSTPDPSRKGSWLRDWNKCFGYDGDQKCIELKCTAWACKGGHLWVKGEEDVYHCYIGPVCSEHNAVSYNLPTYFTTKKDVQLMKIKSHECVVEWLNGMHIKREARRASQAVSENE